MSGYTRSGSRRLSLRAAVVVALVATQLVASPQPAGARGDAAPPAEGPPAPPGADKTVAPPVPALAETSTLAQWKAAPAAERARLAVHLSRKHLGSAAADLAVATAAMEITGCLSATARDPRFEAWTVARTATTCLTAPERPPE